MTVTDAQEWHLVLTFAGQIAEQFRNPCDVVAQA